MDPERERARRTAATQSEVRPGRRLARETADGSRMLQRRAGRGDQLPRGARGAPGRSPRRCFGFSFADANGVAVFGLTAQPSRIEGTRARHAAAGASGCISRPRVENRLATGRYDVCCWV